jgi:ABC-type transporter Mla subunit MlaD
MGEKYVELTAGSAKAMFLKPNSVIIGREPFDTYKFIEKSDQLASNLDQAITNIRQLTTGVNELIVIHRDDLDMALKNLVESSENIKAFTEDIKWHPWKLIRKSKSQKSKPKKEKKKINDK